MIRTKKERGRFIVMCSGMNGTCPNPAEVFDHVRIAHYCRKCLERLLDGSTYWAGDSEEEA